MTNEVYQSHGFRLAWDNDLAFHVSRNALYLRQLRRKSQAQIGKAMHTSQSAVARIEGGDENITLRTLKRLATALDGRIRFAIEPQEINLPQLPAWWKMIGSGVEAANAYVHRGHAVQVADSGQHVLAGWSSPAPAGGNTIGVRSTLSLAESAS